MGILEKLFAKKSELPMLDASSRAAASIAKHRQELEPFVSKMHDRFEFLPTESVVYCFIGKPPAMFGVAWFSGGKEHNLKTMAAAKGISSKKMQQLSLKLGEIYVKYKDEPRYSAEIAGKQVIITPSELFMKEVAETLQPVE